MGLNGRTPKKPVPWFRFNEQCELTSLEVSHKHVTDSDVDRAIGFLSLYRDTDRAKTFVTYCKEIERFLGNTYEQYSIKY